MLPRERSATTSSKSSTSERPVSATAAETDIQYVKGVGPRLGALFKSRGFATVRDLLYFFPRVYEDRTRTLKVAELTEGNSATVALTVRSARRIPVRGRFGSILEVRAADDTGVVALKWFHAPKGMAERFVVGAQFVASGPVKGFMGRPEMVHPEISWGAAGSEENVGRVVPVYTEIDGISTRILRKILWEALERYVRTLAEDLPESLLRKHALPKLSDAVRAIHFPEEKLGPTADIAALLEFRTPAHQRLIYEEFLKFEYLVLKQRLRMQKENAQPFGAQGGDEAARALAKLLPFHLTEGQKAAIREILQDMSLPHPMNRLIQGDVGSGKTAVAFLSTGCVLAEGGQAALMAPTEILAEQHFLNARKLFQGKLNVALLTGRTPAAERASLFARLAGGEPLLLIGTHALLEDPVVFKNLRYILIDEQHRFGVEQRRTLRKKGTHGNSFPHTLILTATPIPRTLALTFYGDLSVSSIRELPPGRSPIVTRVARTGAEVAAAYQKIRQELQAGRQAYFIFPLVNESEAEGFEHLKSATEEAARLQRDVFPQFKVGLLHGQQKSDEKAAVMARFKAGELHVLVSTTVVEVGVDVPNATVIAIEHAERFGLSQLHQLRGRVGRGTHASSCFLFSHERVGDQTRQRLEVLEQTTDGFKIAEADLEIRGPGEFLGTRQSGGLPFKLGNLVRDQDWLLKARDDAMALVRDDEALEQIENQPLRRYYEREGQAQFERLKTS